MSCAHGIHVILFQVLNFSSRKRVIQHLSRMLLTVKPFGFLLFILGGWYFSLNFFSVCPRREVVLECIFHSGLWLSPLSFSLLWDGVGGGSKLLNNPHLTDPTDRKGAETPGAWRSPSRSGIITFPLVVNHELLVLRKNELAYFQSFEVLQPLLCHSEAGM